MTVEGLNFTEWGNTGALEEKILDRLNFIKDNIDKDCEKWPMSAEGPFKSVGEYADALTTGKLIGYANVIAPGSGTVNNANFGSGVLGGHPKPAMSGQLKTGHRG